MSNENLLKRPELPTIEQICFDLDKFDINKKTDLELNESLNIDKVDNEGKIENYEKAKNYIQVVNEIQNSYSLSTNNSQLETLLKNIDSLKYYIDILKNLSNLSK
jgi:hypothetical protein